MSTMNDDVENVMKLHNKRPVTQIVRLSPSHSLTFWFIRAFVFIGVASTINSCKEGIRVDANHKQPGWQNVSLKGNAAAVELRVPNDLLRGLNDSFDDGTFEQRSRMVTTISGKIGSFRPWLSKSLQSRADVLASLCKKVAVQSVSLAGGDISVVESGDYCRVLEIAISPNYHFVAAQGAPPNSGLRFEFDTVRNEKYGLRNLGRVASKQSFEAAGESGGFASLSSIETYYVREAETTKGSMWIVCSNELTTNIGYCEVSKDISEAVFIKYRMCVSMLPYWAQFDSFVSAIVSEFTISSSVANSYHY